MGSIALHAGWDGPGPWIGLVWLALLAAIVTVVVIRARRGCFGPPRGHGSAEAVLAERYARGEIDRAEFDERLTTVRAS